jgi:hypothetical protein
VSSYFFDRRRSEAFAELLDDPSRIRSHRRPSRAQAEMDWGAEMLLRLGRFPQRTAAPAEFRDGLRALLMTAAQRDGIGALTNGVVASVRTGVSAESAIEDSAHRTENTVALGALADKTQPVRQLPRSHRTQSLLRSQTPGTGRARAAVLIGVTAGALALSGVSAASTDSLPGDPLYQVKRSSERAQLALAASDQTRGQLYLEFAHSRVLEAHQIGSGLVPDVLADMDGETVAGVKLLTSAAVQRHDANILAAVTTFVTDQRRRLADLHKTLTATGTEPLRRSAKLLDTIEQRIRALTNALVKGCEIATTDNLGPKPTTC